MSANLEMTAKPVRKTDAEKENHNQAQLTLVCKANAEIR